MTKEEYLVFVTSWGGQTEDAIITYRLNAETGSLAELHRYRGLENPFYLAVSPDKKRLYAAYAPGDFENAAGFVASFEITGDSGKLAKLNEQPSRGNTTCYVDVDPTGSVVVFANYTSGSIGAYPVQPDGSLGAMSSFVQHHGASRVNESRQEAPHAHCAVISANGRHVYACDLGMDQVVGYVLDVPSATLTPQEQPIVRTIGGGGPRHFTYHPHGRFVYANNELTSSVNVFSYESDLGHLIERQVISSIPDDLMAAIPRPTSKRRPMAATCTAPTADMTALPFTRLAAMAACHSSISGPALEARPRIWRSLQMGARCCVPTWAARARGRKTWPCSASTEIRESSKRLAPPCFSRDPPVSRSFEGKATSKNLPSRRMPLGWVLAI